MLKLNRKTCRREEEYLASLIQKLLREPDKYFSGGYLNSEGWKIISVVKRLVLRSRSYLARVVKSINSNSSYERVVKVLNSIEENSQRSL
jgi:hypothetical protein